MTIKYIILILISLASVLSSAQKTDSLKIKEIYQKIDSIEYSESDFLEMKKSFANNSELKTIISKKVKQGDESAINFLEILSLSYKKANEKYGEKEVKTMIYSYYISVEVQEKFNKLNSDLDAKLDSLRLQKEYLEKEIKKDKQIINSLKNN